ncbi:DUF4010 domain-containing protein [Hydrogenophaga sp. 5NK40-0174]
MPDGHSLDVANAAAVLACALGCGLLVGIERERRKGQGPSRAFAGVRTFALTCVTGAAAALMPVAGLMIVGAAFVAGMALVAYWRDRSDDPGATTELALVLTYMIGALSAWSIPLAAALAVGMTALLAARHRLHALASQWLSAGEVRDGIILAALVLMALPLVPNRPFWGDVLNPYRIVQLLALLLAVQSLAHFCRRLLQARHAVIFSAFASGFVSSTATIATLGLSVRQGQGDARLMAGGGLISCVATQVQLLLVASAMQPAWLSVLWVPALSSAVVAGLLGWWMVRGAQADGSDAVVSSPRIEGLPSAGDDRMFSLRGAAAVAGLLAGMQVLVRVMEQWLGSSGVLVGTLLGALVDLHSTMAATFAAGLPGDEGLTTVAVVAGLLIHAGSKSLTAGLVGGRRYLAWLAPGLWGHTILCVMVLAAIVWWV